MDIAEHIKLCPGDCMDVLATLWDDSLDSCVTDPPYLLTSIVKRFGEGGSAPAQFGQDGRFKRLSGGFMGRKWDTPDIPVIDPSFAYWMAGFIDGEGCFSVHKKNVNGCETYDCQFSMTLRADDKDIVVEIQKQLGGIGSLADRPAPKEGNGKPQVRYCISSQRDCWRLREVLCVFPLRAKKARDFEIWSAALDAWIAHEPGKSWEDVAYFRDALMAVRRYGADFHPAQLWSYRWARQVYRVLKPGAHLVAFGGTRTYHRMVCAIEDAGFEIRDCIQWLYGSGFPKSHNQGDGWGTALKPACEPIVLARKPLSEKTVAANVQRWGTGAINVDGTRIPSGTEHMRGTVKYSSGGVLAEMRSGGKCDFVATDSPLGRWPANVIHDGSDEVVAAFPETMPGTMSTNRNGRDGGDVFAFRRSTNDTRGHDDDGGSAARFFYTAKADDMDRIGSKHPTVKPLDLMQYLVRLVTPKGGTVLDPFAGTGTTGEAAFREGMKAALIEREAEYLKDIARRMELCMAGPVERQHASIKAKLEGKPRDDGPLFGGTDDWDSMWQKPFDKPEPVQ